MQSWDYQIQDAPEYRRHHIEPISQQTTTVPQKPKQSYASAATRHPVPNKEQAIVAESIEGIETKDYAIAVAKIIGPSNIHYMSRISNGRVCLYLDSKDRVSTLISNNKVITINGIDIELRPLITPSQRIILSNVSPDIPNEILENLMIKNGVRITSKMTHLRAGIHDPDLDLSHILSFRRQIFINPLDINKIPQSFLVNHQETLHRIFVTSDKLICFACKQEGHIAKQCTISNNSNTTTTNRNNNNSTLNNSSETASHENIESNEIRTHEGSPDTNKQSHSTINNELREAYEMKMHESAITRNKRPHSATTEDSIEKVFNFEKPLASELKRSTESHPRSQAKKKTKQNQSLTRVVEKIGEMLEPARTEIEKQENNFILNFTQLKCFLENAIGVEHPTDVANEFTMDTTALIKMMNHIYPLLKERSIKNRLHRLCKKLKQKITETSDDDFRPTSQEESTSNWASGPDSDA